MDPKDIHKLRSLTTFDKLVDYLRDELDWPIEMQDAEDIVFEYEPEELGLDPQCAVKIESIKQIRPLAEGQKGGEFFTPTSLVKLIVEIIEPFKGLILDPAAGSGGMFVQSARFMEEHRYTIRTALRSRPQ